MKACDSMWRLSQLLLWISLKMLDTNKYWPFCEIDEAADKKWVLPGIFPSCRVSLQASEATVKLLMQETKAAWALRKLPSGRNLGGPNQPLFLVERISWSSWSIYWKLTTWRWGDDCRMEVYHEKPSSTTGLQVSASGTADSLLQEWRGGSSEWPRISHVELGY